MYLITSYEDAERYLGKKADKNRKIYNGMLKPTFTSTRDRSRRAGKKNRNNTNGGAMPNDFWRCSFLITKIKRRILEKFNNFLEITALLC